MTAHPHPRSRRRFSYEFEYKVHGGLATWQARVNDGSADRDLEGTFKVSTMGPDETFEQRVVSEIHRSIDALAD